MDRERQLRDVFRMGAVEGRSVSREMVLTQPKWSEQDEKNWLKRVMTQAYDLWPDPPRTLPDPHDPDISWRAENGELQVAIFGSPKKVQYWRNFNGAMDVPVTPERVRLWYDLLTNPTE